MQAGTFGTVPAVSVLALLAGRKRLAASLAVGGTIAWIGAKLIKPFGGRARPQGVLPDVTIREGIEGDLGWVSGHTAVATTLAFVAAEELPRTAAAGPGGDRGDGGVRSDVRRGASPARRGRRRRPRDDDLGRDPAGRGRLSHPASALGSRSPEQRRVQELGGHEDPRDQEQVQHHHDGEPERPVQIVAVVEAVGEVRRRGQAEQAHPDPRQHGARHDGGPGRVRMRQQPQRRERQRRRQDQTQREPDQAGDVERLAQLRQEGLHRDGEQAETGDGE